MTKRKKHFKKLEKKSNIEEDLVETDLYPSFLPLFT